MGALERQQSLESDDALIRNHAEAEEHEQELAEVAEARIREDTADQTPDAVRGEAVLPRLVLRRPSDESRAKELRRRAG